MQSWDSKHDSDAEGSGLFVFHQAQASVNLVTKQKGSKTAFYGPGPPAYSQ